MRHLKAAIGIAVIALAISPPAQAQLFGGTGPGSRANPADILPPDFRGTVTYQGRHEGSLTGRQTRRMGGRLDLVLTFNGNQVTARYSGDGGINNGSMTGTRSGSRCRLTDDRGGGVMEAECTRIRFTGQTQWRSGRESGVSRLEGQATRFVDAAVEEREHREAARNSPAQTYAAAPPRPAAQASPNAGNVRRSASSEWRWGYGVQFHGLPSCIAIINEMEERTTVTDRNNVLGQAPDLERNTRIVGNLRMENRCPRDLRLKRHYSELEYMPGRSWRDSYETAYFTRIMDFPRGYSIIVGRSDGYELAD